MFKRRIAILIILALMALWAPALVSAAPEADNPFAAQDQARQEALTSLGQIAGQSRLMAVSGEANPDILQAPSLTRAGSYLVQFKEEVAKSDIYQRLEAEDYCLIGDSDRRLVRLTTDDLAAFKAKAGDLVAQVEADAIRTIQGNVNDPYAGQQWALTSLNLYGAWDITIGNPSVCVALIDTGVNRNHPDLVQADIRRGWDYLTPGGDMVQDDPEGHGTCVTGIIAATVNNGEGIAGIACETAIIPLRVLDQEGQGATSDTIQAIYDAVDIGCKIINLSLGSKDYVYAEQVAIRYALDRGVIVIAAAGNDQSSDYSYPASYPGVISVAAIDRGHLRSRFSNYNDQVSLCAPGQGIITTLVSGGYDSLDGTSFAAPQIAGVAALALALRPQLDADRFMDLARAHSQDLGPAGYDVYYGYGLIDAEALLKDLKVRFDDVSSSAWYFGYVTNLARRGIINGYPNGSFKPDQEVRRDHAAKMIANASGLDRQGKRATFSDVQPQDEMSAYIQALVEKGAIRGYPDGSYRPDTPIIREHVCQIVAKAFDLEEGGLTAAFTDLSGQAEADTYIQILASNGIVKGTGQGRFKPKAEVTRAELSKILSLAMAVSSIQSLEREGTEGARDRAQALIDSLPQDQDRESLVYLQTRLDAVSLK